MFSCSPRNFLSLPSALVVLLLLGAGGDEEKGCRCGPKPPPDDDAIEEPTGIRVQDVETELQVVSIDPSRGDAGTSFPARLYGAGFRSGAEVTVGERSAESVRFLDENTLSLTVPALPAGYHDVRVSNPGGETALLRRGVSIVEGGPDCSFLRVHFGFDESGLSKEASDAILVRMPCYQGGTGEIRIEGHADERGTTDYNLALGQRRADAVARHLVAQGVARSRVLTVSYGEERPVNTGHDEAAWGENRRADIHASN